MFVDEGYPGFTQRRCPSSRALMLHQNFTQRGGLGGTKRQQFKQHDPKWQHQSEDYKNDPSYHLVAPD